MPLCWTFTTSDRKELLGREPVAKGHGFFSVAMKMFKNGLWSCSHNSVNMLTPSNYMFEMGELCGL